MQLKLSPGGCKNARKQKKRNATKSAANKRQTKTNKCKTKQNEEQTKETMRNQEQLKVKSDVQKKR